MTSSAALPMEVGAYVAESVLGIGGMGVVYRGRAPDGSTVAIKMLHDSPGPGVTERFFVESTLRVDHPNVVCAVDAGVADGRPFMIQEYLEGEPLDQKLLRGDYPWREAIGLGIQLCRGLAEVHERGIVHRDLKPANIFLAQDGVVKLLDFGIARSMARETRMTAEGTVIGTPAYLAPEQARGSTTVNERSDIWALGVLLYEVITGISPFERETVAGCLVAVLFDTPPPLSTYVPSVPEELSWLIEGCLQKDPASRTASATEVRLALEYLVGAPSMVVPAQQAQGIRRPSISSGERRIVALLLGEDVRDEALLAKAVEEQGGLFSPLLGNRAVGVFGAERWDGDEAVRAASAALRCRSAAGRLAVASGRAEGGENFISGAAMDRAQEACDARLDGIAVDRDTADLLSDRFRMRECRSDLFELVAERRGTERPRAGSVRTFGREFDLAQIQLAIQLVPQQRRAMVVFVTGPPGAGKSQILREARVMLEAAGEGTVLRATGRSLQREVSLSFMRSALLRRATALSEETDVEAHAPPEERRQAVFELARDALGDEARARECSVFLGELLGLEMLEEPSLQAARADPLLMADRLRLALHDFVGGLLGQGPLALLLEDLHFADEGSLAFIDELLRDGARPLLVLCTMRPEFEESHADLFGGHRLHVVRLPLRGLARGAVAELASAVAGAAVSAELVDALLARTEGNPLFVSQIVATLRDANQLDRSHATLPLPLSVEAAVQSRLDHLPAKEKDACRRAAVLGRPFTAAELTALGTADAGPVLESLARREFFGTSGSSTSPVYGFRSPVVLDVAYGMLDATLCAALHSRAADYLARSAPEDSGSTAARVAPEEIARHLELGDRPDEAVRWYATAALEAVARADSATVLRASERALVGELAGAMRFDLHMARADALRFAGRRSEQEAEINRALWLAENEHQRARALVEHVAWLVRMGRSSEAVEVAGDAVASADASEDRVLTALARGRRAEALIAAGSLEEALAGLDAAEAELEGSSPHLAGMLAGWRARLAVGRGDVGEARAAYAAAADLLGRAGDIRRAAVAELNVADAYNRIGDYQAALDALSRALEAVRRVGHRPGEAYALLNVGYARAQLGDETGAFEALDTAQALGQEQGDARLLLFVSIYRSLALLRDDPAGARVEALLAATQAAESGQTALAAMALSAAARAALRYGDAEAALEHSTRALALRDELGGLEENEADVFVTHARALRANGQPLEARDVLARGRRRIEELAAHIADPEWRERYLNGLPEHRELMEALESSTG